MAVGCVSQLGHHAKSTQPVILGLSLKDAMCAVDFQMILWPRCRDLRSQVGSTVTTEAIMPLPISERACDIGESLAIIHRSESDARMAGEHPIQQP